MADAVRAPVAHTVVMKIPIAFMRSPLPPWNEWALFYKFGDFYKGAEVLICLYPAGRPLTAIWRHS
jgi:hypothetical protein